VEDRVADTSGAGNMDSGVVATRREIGTRYAMNIGCLAAPTPNPIAFITDLRRGLTVKRFTEYGGNYTSFGEIARTVGDKIEADSAAILGSLLQKPIAVLDLSDHQKRALAAIDISTLGQALSSTEDDFMRADYIGPKRSRKIKNVVTAAVIEYLSG
jgi:hypothetical protein